MNHTVSLMVVFGSAVKNLTTGCVSFRLEKERYTPYTSLRARWYCPPDVPFDRVSAIGLYIDGKMRHYGYPTSVSVEREGSRTLLEIASAGFTAALTNNQCADGMLNDINLESLAAAGETFPAVAYQPDTPTVNYVNYYDGTSSWEAIVCYSLRATGYYPYIAGYNTVRIEPPEDYAEFITDTSRLIFRGRASDNSKIISKITEKDIDGTPGKFVATNSYAARNMIVRCREIPFDREWIMDSKAGLQYRLDYSMRGMDADVFCWPGCDELDLTDFVTVTDIDFVGEASRIIIEGSAAKGITTTVWCYHDAYCI